MKTILVASALALGGTPVVAHANPSQTARTGELAELEFTPGSASLGLTSTLGVGKIAAWAKANPDALVVLDGHADHTGPAPANVALSLRRAQTVRDQLVELGLDPDQIVIAAYGESGPQRGTNRTVVAWGTRAGMNAIISRTMSRGNAVLWTSG
jgi:outer membrane protein OmpA-like peptidoglycan-associated protein